MDPTPIINAVGEVLTIGIAVLGGIEIGATLQQQQQMKEQEQAAEGLPIPRTKEEN